MLLDTDQAYNDLACTFRNLVDKHALPKIKVLRGNSAPFMTLGIRKGNSYHNESIKGIKKIRRKKMNLTLNDKEINLFP